VAIRESSTRGIQQHFNEHAMVLRTKQKVTIDNENKRWAVYASFQSFTLYLFCIPATYIFPALKGGHANEANARLMPATPEFKPTKPKQFNVIHLPH